MSEKEFLNWLMGFLDAIGDDSLTLEQTKKIKEKMETVVSKSNPIPYIPTYPEYPIYPVYPTYPTYPSTGTKPLPKPVEFWWGITSNHTNTKKD